MRNRLATLAAAAAGVCVGWAASPLQAADFGATPIIVPPPPHVAAAFDWSGHYVGVHLGALGLKGPAELMWGDGDYVGPDTPTADAIEALSNQRLAGHGWGGGLQAGWNVQNGAFVGGIEADVSAFSGGSAASATELINITTTTISYSAKAAWLATLRARAGVAADRFLLYGTAGIGVGDIEYAWTYEDSDNAGGLGTASARATRAVAVIGAGVEYAIHERASVKLEYIYAPLGASTADGTVTDGFSSNAVAGSADLGLHFLRLGFNWRFGGAH